MERSGQEMGPKNHPGRGEGLDFPRAGLVAHDCAGSMGWVVNDCLFSTGCEAAKGQSDKREEIGFLSFILPTAAFSQPASQILTGYCGPALSSLLSDIHSPWLQPSWASPAWPPAPVPICG